MPFNYKINQSQTIIGLIILALVVALGIYIGGKPAIFLFTGVALGYTLTRSRYGFAGGIKRIYITGEGSLSKALIVMFGITIVLSAIIHISAASKGGPIPGISSVHFLNISTILGGFLFGIGMMIAGGCASGTLTDMGEGAIRAVIALIFFIIGTLPGLVIKGLLDNSALGKIGIKVYLPDVIGYIGSVLLSLLILFGLFILTKKYEAFRKKEGFYEELTYETIEKSLPKEEANIYHKVFVERWSFLKGGIILAILFAIIQLTTGHSWGITAGFTNWGVGFLQSLGVKFTSPAFQTTVNTVNNGLLKDTVGMRNLGILLGAAISFLLAGRFKFDFDFKVKDGLFYAFGGLLMGFGARLSGGCNVGALYSGIGNFSLAGWVYFIFLALGGIFALKVLAGKVNTVPPNRHDKKMV